MKGNLSYWDAVCYSMNNAIVNVIITHAIYVMQQYGVADAVPENTFL